MDLIKLVETDIYQQGRDMKQRLKRKRVSPALGILIVLALVAGVVLLSAAFFVIADLLRALGINAAFMQYAQYIVLIVAGVFIVRRYMTEYEYTLENDTLKVDRYTGARPRTLLLIKLLDIVSMDTRKPSSSRLQHLSFRSRKSGGVYITYTEDGRKKCAYLSLNAQMQEFISQGRDAKR